MRILITGGTSGLGVEMIRLFAQHKDYKIEYTFSNSFYKNREIEEKYNNCTGIKCDYRDSDDVENLCKRIELQTYGLLINNTYCGDFIGDSFHKTDVNHFRRDFEFNVLPTIKISSSVLFSMLKAKSGTIINVLSQSLNEPMPGSSSYTGVKGYMHGLTKSWSSEYGKKGIRVVGVYPNIMPTRMTRQIDPRIFDLVQKSSGRSFLSTEETAKAIYKIAQNGDPVSLQL